METNEHEGKVRACQFNNSWEAIYKIAPFLRVGVWLKCAVHCSWGTYIWHSYCPWILTWTPGNFVLTLYSCLAISSKSMNLNIIWVTAPAACIPQFLSKASRDWVPYKVKVSPSRSAKLLRSVAVLLSPWLQNKRCKLR